MQILTFVTELNQFLVTFLWSLYSIGYLIALQVNKVNLALRDRNVEFKLWKRCLYVHWQWKFHLWPLDLVKDKIHGLHSLQQEDCQRPIKTMGFLCSIPYWNTSTGHFGARVDVNVKVSKSFNEMRMSRSLRLLMLLRL